MMRGRSIISKSVMGAFAGAALTGCVSSPISSIDTYIPLRPVGPVYNDPFYALPENPTPTSRYVDYYGYEAPGTILINTQQRKLYYVAGNGAAIEYPVAVGREGTGIGSNYTITRKAEWPTWTPPAEMREREAAKGNILPVSMPGGENNPLGARAMYLGNTLYRIHGTNNPASIGTASSSGCIRMHNSDAIDLYARVSVGAQVNINTYDGHTPGIGGPSLAGPVPRATIPG